MAQITLLYLIVLLDLLFVGNYDDEELDLVDDTTILGEFVHFLYSITVIWDAVCVL